MARSAVMWVLAVFSLIALLCGLIGYVYPLGLTIQYDPAAGDYYTGLHSEWGLLVFDRSRVSEVVGAPCWQYVDYYPALILSYGSETVTWTRRDIQNRCGQTIGESYEYGADARPRMLFRTAVGIHFAIPALCLGAYPLLIIARACQRWRRLRKGLCVACGYDLTGNVSGVCPECGTACARLQRGNARPGLVPLRGQ